MITVYLSGPIAEIDEQGACDWRLAAARWLPGCRILSPIRGKEASLDKTRYTPNELRVRDHWDIWRSDVVLVYFNPPPGYLTWGTPSECEYAANLGKAVVFVCPLNNWATPQIVKHPWAQAQSVHFFDRLQDACKYIQNMWTEE